MAKFKLASQIIGALAGLAALIGLAVSLSQINSGYRDERTKKWQAVVIFSHIEKSGVTGLNFDQLRSKYLDSVQQFPEYDLPKTAISDETLTWILLDLISKQAISPLPDHFYKVSFEPAFVRDPNAPVFQQMQAVSERVLFYSVTEPKKYNVTQMVDKIAAEFPKLTPVQIRMVVNQGFKNGNLNTDEKGNVFVNDGMGGMPDRLTK